MNSEVMMQNSGLMYTGSVSAGDGHSEVPPEERTQVSLYVATQQKVDQDEKALAARWVADELAPKNGEGLFLDAGTSCQAVWEKTLQRIEDTNHAANLCVVTNSLLVVKDWIDHLMRIPALQGTTLEIAGEIPDVPHMAFYGEALRKALESKYLRLSAVYIGASGIEFDAGAGILLGYHAGEPERHCKEYMFQCPCKGQRVILATPGKIGNPGGRVLDILSIEPLDKAPIYLVTAEPRPADIEDQKRFAAAEAVLTGDAMRKRLLKLGLQFYWIIVDRKNATVKKRIPCPPEGELALAKG